MPASESRIRVKRIDTVTQVEFVDRNILDEGNIQLIEDEIAGLVDGQKGTRLLISFANVEHLSSRVLGMLIKINTKVQQSGGQLRLADIEEEILDVFRITRLDKLFSIHPSAEAAIKSFK